MFPDCRILAIDVGAGTQDVLVFDPSRSIENCIQLVLPSPSVIAARRLARARLAGRPALLAGNTMGGGAVSGAVQRHLKEGLAVYATPLAARTLHNDLAVVRSMGVDVVEDESSAPPAAVRIEVRDVDLKYHGAILEGSLEELPEKVAVAVQDHGEAPPGMSNRAFRFEEWERFIKEKDGRLEEVLYFKAPAHLPRMAAVERDVPGVILMDTGASAIWGALCDPVVARAARDGALVLNIGNGHTLGALVKSNRILGLFEHHTSMMTAERLGDHVESLRRGELRCAEVFSGGGHGAFISPEYRPKRGGFELVAVTGPNRRLAEPLPYYLAVPCGDMMLSGCFGLLAGIAARSQKSVSSPPIPSLGGA